jgi:RNase adaptor protein for sRNA GlmZ degradation
VQSFAYKDGYPHDERGYGGGYVFDCRALPNPHKLPELKDKTGEENAVADFLESSARVLELWENVRAIVDSHVLDYVDAGRSSLTVSFGCTGGKHRSVFMARKLAKYLTRRFPNVEVRLIHEKL